MIWKLFNRNKVWVAAAGIIEKNNAILLTKRSAMIAERGKWCLPGGGIKHGETAEHAMRREIKEEIGLEAKTLRFLFYHDKFVPRMNLHTLMLVFKVTAKGIPKPNYEVADIEWFNRKEISALNLAFTHRDILHKYFTENKK